MQLVVKEICNLSSFNSACHAFAKFSKSNVLTFFTWLLVSHPTSLTISSLSLPALSHLYHTKIRGELGAVSLCESLCCLQYLRAPHEGSFHHSWWHQQPLIENPGHLWPVAAASTSDPSLSCYEKSCIVRVVHRTTVGSLRSIIICNIESCCMYYLD